MTTSPTNGSSTPASGGGSSEGWVAARARAGSGARRGRRTSPAATDLRWTACARRLTARPPLGSPAPRRAFVRAAGGFSPRDPGRHAGAPGLRPDHHQQRPPLPGRGAARPAARKPRLEPRGAAPVHRPCRVVRRLSRAHGPPARVRPPVHTARLRVRPGSGGGRPHRPRDRQCAGGAGSPARGQRHHRMARLGGQGEPLLLRRPPRRARPQGDQRTGHHLSPRGLRGHGGLRRHRRAAGPAYGRTSSACSST